MRNTITKNIYEAKHQASMNYDHYMHLLDEGFEILKTNTDSFTSCKQLNQLRAVRIALEYRIEVLRQFRKKQIQKVGDLLPAA